MGETYWDVRANPQRDSSGQVSGLMGVSIDITARRRAEEAVLQAQKLESLSVLAGGIAHDFNNLLVSILGNAGLALLELSPESPARESIEDIQAAGQRAAELARQMLAYSGKGHFVVQRIDLSQIVREMTHLLRASIGKSAALRFDSPPSLPAVEADATQLRQVVMNLVLNASDAIGDQEGVIRVSTGVRHATRADLAREFARDDLPGGDYVFLEVADTGVGMDAETRSRIFDPFFTTKFTGRGLGLAAVLGIVRGHRGAIRVDSEPGSGTTFVVLLPAAGGALAQQDRETEAERGAKLAGVVLVVDDEPSVLAVTSRALRAFGMKVLSAPDGQEAVRTFQQHAGEIDCVLLDMTMPGMTGEDTIRALRAIRPGASVILMSGYSESEVSNRFAEHALSGFIQKPFELRVLREAIDRVLDAPRQ